MLAEVLYYIFIFPLEQVIGWLIGLFHSITHSYGVSIILLSLFVNLFFLKLTAFFELKSVNFAALKAQCDNKVREFKRVFKGSELQSYIRTLYKQKHFHPIYALAGLGGLALQIPFFIAMLLLVQHVEYFNGVSFLYIQDLAQADSLKNLLGESFAFIHLLPLLMCFLTLINVFYSLKGRDERIQGAVIALIFLVLLYDMPSVLVLYWTCNMAFALLKTLSKKLIRRRESVDSLMPPPITYSKLRFKLFS